MTFYMISLPYYTQLYVLAGRLVQLQIKIQQNGLHQKIVTVFQ